MASPNKEPRVESTSPVGWLQPFGDLVMKTISPQNPEADSLQREASRSEPDDVLTPKVKSIEARLEIVEQVAKKAVQENGAPAAAMNGTKSDAQSDLDMLFEEPVGNGMASPKEPGGGEPEASGMSAICGPVWGGPVAPYEDDNIWTWVSNFFGGVTTAHGINRAFDDNNGLCRRIFWICLFFCSLVILVLQLESSFADYFSAATTTNIDTQDGSNVMPMMTVCNVSPIRCGCEGFYMPEIRDNDEYLARVLPFLCGAVLGYNEEFTGQVDGDGRRLNIQILETARDRVDLTKTRNKMMTFTSTLTCDSGPYTKEWFVEAVKSGDLTTQDLMNYAGYNDRGRLVRFCQSKDDVSGEKVSCMDDRYWSPAKFDEQFGACHTLNPCYEFPVGQECETDEDCLSELGPRVRGGVCGADKTCECTLCKAGSDCRVISQLKTGRGEGVRMVLNVAVDQDAQITSAEKARWAPGALIHFHTYASNRALGGAVTAAPGRITDLLIGQSVFDKVKRFPWTQCYEHSITDANQCENACLKRVQAIECCGLEVPHVEDGRFPAITEVDPSGAEVRVDNPTLLCNILDPALEACMNRQTQRLAEGTICVDGAATEKSAAYWGLLQRVGWYDPGADGDDDGIPDQEEDQWKIEQHCVWKEVDRKLPDDTEESRHGLPCEDSDKCKSDTGDEDRQGECRKAYRAYCPGRCEELSFEVISQSSSLLSETAAQIMANDELAWVSYQASVDPNRQRRWQPRCGRDANGTYIDTDTCFTTAEAISLVRTNYAMINVDYENFDRQIITIEDKIPTDVLLGTVGGNLGMWVGMSVMTITEMFELLFFAILSAPFFYFGIKVPFLRKREPPEVPEEVADEDVQRVLHNIKTIARRRKEGKPLAAPAAGTLPGPPPVKPHSS